MKTITLKQEAYANSGEVRNGIYILGSWFEAMAEDDEGNVYRVVWEVIDFDSEDASHVCNWDTPWVVLDDTNTDVSDSVQIA